MYEIVIGIITVVLLVTIGVIYNALVYGWDFEYWDNILGSGFGIVIIGGSFIGVLWLVGNIISNVLFK